MNDQENKVPETVEQPSAIAEIGEQNEPPVEEEEVTPVAEDVSTPAEEPLPVAPEQPEKEEPVENPEEEIRTEPVPASPTWEEPTEHSAKYEKVLGYYKSCSWNEKQVRNAVAKDWITPAEFTEITGKEY